MVIDDMSQQKQTSVLEQQNEERLDGYDLSDEELDECPHEMETVDILSRSDNYVERLLACIYCSKTKSVKVYHGVRD